MTEMPFPCKIASWVYEINSESSMIKSCKWCSTTTIRFKCQTKLPTNCPRISPCCPTSQTRLPRSQGTCCSTSTINITTSILTMYLTTISQQQDIRCLLEDEEESSHGFSNKLIVWSQLWPLSFPVTVKLVFLEISLTILIGKIVEKSIQPQLSPDGDQLNGYNIWINWINIESQLHQTNSRMELLFCQKQIVFFFFTYQPHPKAVEGCLHLLPAFPSISPATQHILAPPCKVEIRHFFSALHSLMVTIIPAFHKRLKIPFWFCSIFIYVDQHHETSEHLSAPQLAHLQGNPVINLKGYEMQIDSHSLWKGEWNLSVTELSDSKNLVLFWTQFV